MLLVTFSFQLVFGWVREVSERLHASGVYSSRERINRNEQAELATIEVAEAFASKAASRKSPRMLQIEHLTICPFRHKI